MRFSINVPNFGDFADPIDLRLGSGSGSLFTAASPTSAATAPAATVASIIAPVVRLASTSVACRGNVENGR